MLDFILKEYNNKPLAGCTNQEIYNALVRYVKEREKKKLYYVSAEFLMGKMLRNNLLCMGCYQEVEKELMLIGKSLNDIEACEMEPSLGNGGLGRLAACFLDSIATLGLNGDGIGLNYHLGLFRQVFCDHLQTEQPDKWLENETWLIDRKKEYTVNFGDKSVVGRLYDMPIIGYENRTNYLHLFDLLTVDENIVIEGIKFDKTNIEKNLTLFLYPDDSNEEGKNLRLYQQYFLASCAVQFILEEAMEKGSSLYDLSDYVVIQINDTHPSIMIPEMIRLLRAHGIEANQSREIASKLFAYM